MRCRASKILSHLEKKAMSYDKDFDSDSQKIDSEANLLVNMMHKSLRRIKKPHQKRTSHRELKFPVLQHLAFAKERIKATTRELPVFNIVRQRKAPPKSTSRVQNLLRNANNYRRRTTYASPIIAKRGLVTEHVRGRKQAHLDHTTYRIEYMAPRFS